jgi:hypothetical protein
MRPRRSSRSTSSSRPAPAARAASACTSPSTARRSATPASTASASCSSSRRAAEAGDGRGERARPVPLFFWAIVKALVAGDVLNALGYRIRPYEVNVGDTDRAIDQCKEIIYKALENRTNILVALWKCKPILER